MKLTPTLLCALLLLGGCATHPEEQPVTEDDSADPFFWASHLYSGHGSVLVARQSTGEVQHLLITPNSVIELGRHRRGSFKLQRLNDESDLLHLSYATGWGSGVSHHRVLLILLRHRKKPLMADVYAGGYVDDSWGLKGEKGIYWAEIKRIEVSGEQLTVHYEYGIEESDTPSKKYTETIQLQPYPAKPFQSAEVMRFMGFTDEEDSP